MRPSRHLITSRKAEKSPRMCEGVFTLGDVHCKGEVHVNFEVSKNQSKPFFDINCKVAVIAVKNSLKYHVSIHDVNCKVAVTAAKS